MVTGYRLVSSSTQVSSFAVDFPSPEVDKKRQPLSSIVEREGTAILSKMLPSQTIDTMSLRKWFCLCCERLGRKATLVGEGHWCAHLWLRRLSEI